MYPTHSLMGKPPLADSKSAGGYISHQILRHYI